MTSVATQSSSVSAAAPLISFKPDATSSSKPFFLDPEYMPWHRTHSISSDEQVLLAEKIIQSIETFRGRGQKVIDIGCADGGLTRRFARLFKSITVFEPNELLFSHAVSKLSRETIQLHPYNEVFPPSDDVLLDNFDTAIVSHVLYHVDKEHWHSFFNAVSRALRMGGVCIVALWNEESQARDFLRRAAPERRFVCSAEDLLSHKGKSLLFDAGLEIVKVEKIAPVIKAHSQSAAESIIKFLLGSERRATSAEAQTEFKNKVTTHGLKNWQSVITIQKREARLMPALTNSPWMRGAPQNGLAELIRRIRSRNWALVLGGPGRRNRDRQ
jgi:2-polyprenyl-3-methyl-5-hydroxy-6-metoxy-1,4-benzoquinol methylase